MQELVKRGAKHLRGRTPPDGVGCSEPPVLSAVQPARSWLMPGCVLPFVPSAARIERLRAFRKSIEEDPIPGVGDEVTLRGLL